MERTEFTVTTILSLVISVLVLVFFIKYHWNRRWLYYHSSKLPGPSSWPLIGSAHYFLGGYDDMYQAMLRMTKSQPPRFKVWLGQDLIFVTSRPEDCEIILNKCFTKGTFARFMAPVFWDGLLTSPAIKWKGHRKIINPSFNIQILNSFIDVFNKHAQKLVERMRNHSSNKSVDISYWLFRSTVDISCETLMDVDADLITGQDEYINDCIKAEKFSSIRMIGVWYHPEFLWNLSPLGKLTQATSNNILAFVRKMINTKKQQPEKCNDDFSVDLKKKHFLNNLLKMSENFDDEDILEETQTMLLAASETTGLTMSSILLVLAIFPEVQEKIYEELDSILWNNDNEITLEHINKMVYLEAVIKEVMRVLPTVPYINRIMTEDLHLENCTVPTGSNIIISIKNIHDSPDLWENPQKFNPERFLNKEEINRSRCAYMPFGFGPRNCIGFKFAMLSMKVMLATLLKNFTFEPAIYNSIEEIECFYNIVAKPKKGYKVKFTERKLYNNNNKE
ncbi:cytochrome P450 4C1-like [Tribolium madens]|uniref:cytochrome P450 4C1-like n=1 Tax=Tribolium madens TaxID=41895 RepID=UPI001CF73FA6|nr:cytochrome P450 4C1-like [Tribolium madens]